MVRYLARRLAAMLVTLVAISIIIFIMSEVVPVNPARAILGQYATEANVKALHDQMGLDRPVYERYGQWLWNLLHGDLGQSFRLGVDIKPLLFTRLRNSVMLAIMGMLMLVPVALLAGVAAGLAEGRWPDWVISGLALLTTSLPDFVTGIILIMVFAWWLPILPGASMPTEGGGNPLASPSQLILPAATLALSQLGYVIRITRVSVARVVKSPYVRTAVLKGLPWRTVVLRHVLRNALLAPITVLTTQLGWMVGGLVVIESVFAYPGLGRLFAGAAVGNDIPMLEASAVFGVMIAVFSQLLADLVYGFLNPLIRYN